MIIAFYPGAGGHRFYQWVQGLREFEQNRRYDELCQTELKQKYSDTSPYTSQPDNQWINDRYLTADTQVIQHPLPVVFTHCVNYELITHCWPGHELVYFIDADRSKSLRRQWKLFQQFVSTDAHPVGGPFNTISWHNEYYTQYPWSTGSGITVDHQEFFEFSTMLQQELDSVVCPEFDFAQQMFDQHGPSAPIQGLYNQQYDNK
jgi:hypothetical protein